MLFHGFAQRHRLMAIVVAVSVVGIMTSVGCGTTASRASGPAAGGPMVIVVRDDANGRRCPLGLEIGSSWFSQAATGT